MTNITTALANQPLLLNFAEHVSKGTLTKSHNMIDSIHHAIEKIDQIIDTQLNAVLHHKQFQTLEASWRGLFQLCHHEDNGNDVKIKVCHMTKAELVDDFNNSVEFDQSYLFKKIYESEYGTPGGHPYAAIIGDFYFDHSTTDVSILRHISAIAAASFSPFISAAAPHLFGLNEWQQLNKPRDLSQVFATKEHTAWKRLREQTDSRFISLTLPRAIARPTYSPISNNSSLYSHREIIQTDNDHCWMNAAYLLAGRMISAHTQFGWCTSIRGAEGGGKITELPLSHRDQPTEVAITDRREAELSQLGFIPLCHYKNTDYAVFFGAESIHSPPLYDSHNANANAAISARLPYLMATSRFAHYLKIMARDKIGSFMDAIEIENWLNRWILNYVNSNPTSSQQLKAKYPLANAKVELKTTPGKPGSYHAVAWLQPWLQVEELTTSLRLVAQIPHLRGQ